MTVISIPGFHEPFSSLSHLLAAGLALIIGIRLICRAWGHPGRVLAVSVFVLCSAFLLSMSGVYHLLGEGPGRDVLQRLDHAAIFALIAGTFTPVHAIAFRRLGRWGMLTLIWLLAATAITIKMVFFSNIPEWLSLTLYLGMGWLGSLSGYLLWSRYGYQEIRPLVWGAVAYTAGALVDLLRIPVLLPGVIGAHELFHLAVLVGIASHWLFIHRLTVRAPLPHT